MKILFTPAANKFFGKERATIKGLFKLFLLFLPKDTTVIVNHNTTNNELHYTVENSEYKIFTNTSFEIQYKK